jgi:hypothetical protein
MQGKIKIVLEGVLAIGLALVSIKLLDADFYYFSLPNNNGSMVPVMVLIGGVALAIYPLYCVYRVIRHLFRKKDLTN